MDEQFENLWETVVVVRAYFNFKKNQNDLQFHCSLISFYVSVNLLYLLYISLTDGKIRQRQYFGGLRRGIAGAGDTAG